MLLFCFSFFPIIYAEVICGRAAGTTWLISYCLNIGALFFGMCIMFNLMRKIAVQALESLKVEEFEDKNSES